MRLSPEDAVILYETAPLHALMSSALLRRQQQVPGGEVTYLIDRNVNYTNACTINCQFCSFYRPIGHDEVYTQTIDEISQRLSELEAIGGVRVLMQGGVNPDLPFSWYTDVLRELRVRHPSIDLDCFSPIEIQGMSEITGLSTVEVLRALKEAGMHGCQVVGLKCLWKAYVAMFRQRRAGQNNGFESCVKRSPSTSSPAPPTCLDSARAPWSGLSTLSACVTCRMRPSRG